MKNYKMIKKFSALSLIAVMIMTCFCACGKTEEEKKAEKKAEIEKELGEDADTLEERLAVLEASEWEKTDAGYKYSSTNEEDNSKCTFVITAKGNDAKMKLTFDYGSDNKDMVKFYKGDESAVKGLAGYWFKFACKEAGVSGGNVEYTFYVADTKVGSGKMSYAEAEEACEYFED